MQTSLYCARWEPLWPDQRQKVWLVMTSLVTRLMNVGSKSCAAGIRGCAPVERIAGLGDKISLYHQDKATQEARNYACERLHYFCECRDKWHSSQFACRYHLTRVVRTLVFRHLFSAAEISGNCLMTHTNCDPVLSSFSFLFGWFVLLSSPAALDQHNCT